MTAREEELEVAIERLAGLLRSMQHQEKPPIPVLSPAKSPHKPSPAKSTPEPPSQPMAEAEVL